MSLKQPENDPLAERLAGLKPAAGSIDSRELFYRAGFAAGRASMQSTLRKQCSLAVAASVLLTMLSGALLNSVVSDLPMSQSPVVDKDAHKSLPTDNTTPSRAHQATATQLASSEAVGESRVAAKVSDSLPDPALPLWMRWLQSSRETPVAAIAPDSLPSVYGWGLNSADWSRLTTIPRPAAPPVDDIEFVAPPDDGILYPLDGLRLRSSWLFPWL